MLNTGYGTWGFMPRASMSLQKRALLMSSAATPTPDPEHLAEIINLGEARVERAKHEPETAFEAFLLSKDAEQTIGKLSEIFEHSDNIALDVHEEVKAALDRQRRQPHFGTLKNAGTYDQLDDGSEASRRPELLELYMQNELFNHYLHHAEQAKHIGDLEAHRGYLDTVQLLSVLIRYEWLQGTYEAHDPKWGERLVRAGYLQGEAIHMGKLKGHLRPTVVRRQRRPLT
jgi:hypothetical protein